MATLLAGQNSAGTTGDFAGNGSTCVWPFTASASGTSALMWCQFKTANPTLSDCRLGIYANSAGAPSGAPLGVATATAGYTGTGLFSAPVSGVSIVSGTQYWLGFWATGEQIDIQGTSSATGREDNSANFANPHSNDGGMAVTPVIWIEDGAGPVAPLPPQPGRVAPIRLQFFHRKLFGVRRLPTAPAAAGPRFIDLVFAAEADAAQALTNRKLVSLVNPTETDAAQALTKRKLLTFINSTEADAAQAITKRVIWTPGVSAETDAAQAMTKRKFVTLGIAAESDVAVGITYGATQFITLIPATESNVAQALTLRKLKTLGIAAETDAAQALSSVTRVTLQAAAEADVAQALVVLTRVNLGVTTTTDAAVGITARKLRTFTPATTTETAQALSAKKRVSFSPTAEFDVAVPITIQGQEVTIVYKYRGPVVIGRF